jgi:hypothetical protein
MTTLTFEQIHERVAAHYAALNAQAAEVTPIRINSILTPKGDAAVTLSRLKE